ncbi:MAG: UDP-N-acetylmuramoyl-L-alanyl-D-glutamate--2,6-diaminopimelate ligase [Microthrixaceae bacterium]
MTTVAALADVLGVGIAPAHLTPSAAEAVVTDVTHDSRRVGPGTLFCCVTGDVHDGHRFAPDAVLAGAVALLCEHPLALEVPQLVVGDTRAAMATAAAVVHGRPSEHLGIVGVTGTNGKTTVVSMLTAILDRAGRSARAIGTLTGERTTPESTDLQRLLAELVEDGVTEVAMEVSSHALVLHRVDEVDVDVAVFTNLGVDHLDFHGTPEAYFAAKARLFEPGRCRVGVVNLDDVHGRLLADVSEFEVVGVSIDHARDLVTGPEGSTYTWHDTPVFLPIPGRHNVLDALLAGEAALQRGLTPSQVAEGLAALPVVAGRFETFRREAPGGPVTVIVDYAHTPDALEQALGAARELVAPGARLTVVFGCGGDRDRGKRPMMGAVAARLADRTIVTTDNPRSEDPSRIIEEIRAGVEDRTERIDDRRAAITVAVRESSAGDVVLVAGKGHEQGQVVADRTEPFDDREVVRDSLGGGDAA